MVLRLAPLGDGSAARLLAARGLFEDQRKTEALAEIDNILESDPDHYLTRYYLGEIYSARGDTWRVMFEFGKVLRAHPRHRHTLRRLGDLHFSINAFEAAADCYRRVLEIDPNDVAGWLRLGALDFALGRDQEAVAAFQRAAKINPNIAATGHTIGDFYGLVRSVQATRTGG